MKTEPLKTKGTYEKIYECDGVFTKIYGLLNGQTVMTAAGPDNPSSGEISYLVERRCGKQIVSAHVIESWKKDPHVKNVEFQIDEDTLFVTVTDYEGKNDTITFHLQ